MHAVALRDVPRTTSGAAALRAATAEAVEPMYWDTLAFDRHRLAEMAAQLDGRRYETDDPAGTADKRCSSMPLPIRICCERPCASPVGLTPPELEVVPAA